VVWVVGSNFGVLSLTPVTVNDSRAVDTMMLFLIITTTLSGDALKCAHSLWINSMAYSSVGGS
jgi:hypothetical protein